MRVYVMGLKSECEGVGLKGVHNVHVGGEFDY